MMRGARMKAWPRQKMPSNVSFLPEQRWMQSAIPRDTGKTPRNFVLKTLYFEQPCAVEGLWKLCTQDAECVLDSKRHLREVLKQARDEGFVSFEKQGSSWFCTLTRERFEEVRAMVNMQPEAGGSPMSAGMRGEAAAETTDSAEVYHDLAEQAKLDHLRRLREQTEAAGHLLSEFQRVEVDYVPYTDINGKVQFMWFYQTSDTPDETATATDADADDDDDDGDADADDEDSGEKKAVPHVK